MRCLKRYVAREVFYYLVPALLRYRVPVRSVGVIMSAPMKSSTMANGVGFVLAGFGGGILVEELMDDSGRSFAIPIILLVIAVVLFVWGSTLRKRDQ